MSVPQPYYVAKVGPLGESPYEVCVGRPPVPKTFYVSVVQNQNFRCFQRYFGCKFVIDF